ncbi:MAG: hypothetical protein KF834_10485 [Burkholderiales bacterium]|nr:hypothetical protein [Burkholderiales bacterium]
MDAASQMLPDVPLTEARPKGATAPATPAAAPAPAMDREFIERNQIVERYLSGRLPPRGALEFERFCASHPELLDTLGLPARVHAGLRLLEVGGKPEPWAEKKRPAWEKPPVLIGFALLVVVLLIVSSVLAMKIGDRGAAIAALEKRIAEQPRSPATSTRLIKLVPARGGPTRNPAVIVGGGPVQFADIKIDLAWSKYSNFRITIDREDQGRVAVLHNIAKDSNGHVRLALNSSALGPGNYDLTIQGLTWKGEPVAQAWATIGIQR